MEAQNEKASRNSRRRRNGNRAADSCPGSGRSLCYGVREPATARPPPRLRWLWLGAGAFALQAALIYGLVNTPSGGKWLPFLLPLAHAILLPFLLRNLAFWGMRLILLGLLLNLTVMVANGGLMPVQSEAVQAVGRHEVADLELGSPIPGSKNVFVASKDVRLRELSDILVIPVPRPFTRAISVGDLFVFTGVAIAYAEAIRRSRVLKGRPNG